MWLVSVGVTSIVHHTGHRIDVAYDPRTGLPQSMSHSGGAVVEVACDPVIGRVTGLSVSDSTDADADAVAVTSYEYDVDGRLIAVVDASGGVYRYEYDGASRIVSLIDRENTGYFYRYDDAGRVIAAVGTHGMMGNAYVYVSDSGVDAPVGGGAAVMIETATELDVSEGDARVGERLDRLCGLPVVAALRSGGLAGAALTDGGRGGVADRERPAVWADQVDADPALIADDELLGQVRPWVYRFTDAGDVWRVVSPQAR